MNTDKIKKLSDALESIRNAMFYNPNGTRVSFKTTHGEYIGESIIIFPVKCQEKMTDDLNAAIRPVLEKYAKIFEEAIRKEAGL